MSAMLKCCCKATYARIVILLWPFLNHTRHLALLGIQKSIAMLIKLEQLHMTKCIIKQRKEKCFKESLAERVIGQAKKLNFHLCHFHLNCHTQLHQAFLMI